jgi:hypothetical protein
MGTREIGRAAVALSVLAFSCGSRTPLDWGGSVIIPDSVPGLTPLSTNKPPCSTPFALTGPRANWPMPNPVSTSLPNPMHYTVCGDGAVRDDVTGLVWEQGSTDLGDFVSATNHCQVLSIAGGGWRLPTAIELASLLDFTNVPAIDTQAFPETPSESFWTSTIFDKGEQIPGIYSVSFSDSTISTSRPVLSIACARCVRSAPTAAPSQPFVRVGGEVRDALTGLVWQQGHSASELSWDDAKTYCKSSTVGGRTAGTWRLPSMKELATLWTFGDGLGPGATTGFFAADDPGAKYSSSSARPPFDAGTPDGSLRMPESFRVWELYVAPLYLPSMLEDPAFARCVH